MPRTPSATYRFQVWSEFPLDRVIELVPYLESLGVSDAYLSPVTEARAGSQHGYDVVDPTRINPQIGDEATFDRLAEELHRRGMGLLVDIVPNHMAASPDNPWWLDVLENGQGSPYAGWFDIDWHPAAVKSGLRGKLLVPILGGPYGEILERGELSLGIEPQGLFVRYWDHRLPLAPRSLPLALGPAESALREAWGAGHPVVQRLGELLAAAANLPARSTPDEPPAAGWLRQRAAVKEGIAALFRDHPDAREFVQRHLDATQGTPGDAASFDALDRVLAAQNYWLSYWRLALQEINYRRFFNITDLVAVRAENQDVMDASHAFLVRLAREGKITGFRIDHIDGLWDPGLYLKRLQARVGAVASGPPRRRRPGFFVVVEKILARDEPLPDDWMTAGATGYEFAALLNELLVDPRGLPGLTAMYESHTGQRETLRDVRYEKKKLVMERLFGSEVRSLGDALGRLASLDRHARDIPQSDLLAVLVEVTACLPVYRTYVVDQELRDRDRPYLLEALDEARRRAPSDIGDGAFRFLRRVLLQEPMHGLAGLRRTRLQFLMRWQQFTGAVMAKGLEDTTFYVYNRLVSLNEVGGEPDTSDAEDALLRFHRFNSDRQLHWPGSLNATSTHDTKRSEDVRARIDVLSEMPDDWGAALERWSRRTAAFKTEVAGRPAPGPNQEVLLFQTLLGAWPFDERAEWAAFRERFKEYLLKAAREAAVRTSWIAPDEAHEQALRRFVDEALDPARAGEFLDDARAFQKRLLRPGALNSLTQVLLKATAPGVPDIYQGQELWDFSLVDPDNRRPVDYEARRRAIAALPQGADLSPAAVRALWENFADGRIKLHVTRATLRFRREHADLFSDGDYLPLQVTGPRAAHVVAYARRYEKEWCVVAATRFLYRLGGADGALPEGTWGSTAIVLPTGAASRWHDVLTGDSGHAPPEGRTSLEVSRLFEHLPLCLLHGRAS